jgi:hypothetical protein
MWGGPSGQGGAGMADRPETSADQYAPVQDAEAYLDTKGGVPRDDDSRPGGRDEGRNGPHRRRLEAKDEEIRHQAEVDLDPRSRQ